MLAHSADPRNLTSMDAIGTSYLFRTLVDTIRNFRYKPYTILSIF